jgi:myo-inositol-1-phosphate synthase
MANKKVRVAILGIGNCASSLVQDIHYYGNAKDTDTIPGLIIGPSPYFFKRPPKQFRDNVCLERTEAFINGDSNE